MFRTKRSKKVVARKWNTTASIEDEESIIEKEGIEENAMPKENIESKLEIDINVEKQNDLNDEKQTETILNTQRRRKSTIGKKPFVLGTAINRKGLEKKNKPHIQTEVNGALSFETDEDMNKDSSYINKNIKKVKIKPVAMALNREDEVSFATTSKGKYTDEMLTSLRQEQKVSLKNTEIDEPVPMEDIDTSIDISPINLNSSDVEMKEDEEFIPLESKLLRAKKNRNRVTFGIDRMDSNIQPPMSTIVEEPLVSSSTDEDTDKNEQQWEEELMRRGGYNPQATASTWKPTLKSSISSHRTYPTRKRVHLTSMDEILTKLQHTVDKGMQESEKIAREQSRLRVNVANLNQAIEKTQKDLEMNSRKYEYFQEIEDFVKGLSFCVREKIDIIEKRELETQERWENESKQKYMELHFDISNEIQFLFDNSMTEKEDYIPVGALDYILNEDNTKYHDSLSDTRRNRFEIGWSDNAVWHDVVRDDSVKEIFQDVIDEFRSLENVHKRFESWKQDFPDVYNEVYCDMVVTKFYSIYVRAEMVNCDILSFATTNWRLQSFNWFKVLRHSPSVFESIIHDVILQDKLKPVVSGGRCDPFSATHTQSVVLIVDEITKADQRGYCVKLLGEVLEQFIKKFVTEVKRLCLIAVADNSPLGVFQFGAYQVNRLHALLENLLVVCAGIIEVKQPSLHASGFQALMMLLHQLLAYIGLCHDRQKCALVKNAATPILQLRESTYISTLTKAMGPTRESEFQHVVTLFDPYI